MTQRVHSKITDLGTVDSTQIVALAKARELVLSDAALGLPRHFYTADSQTHGMGQHGRSWISPKGGIYLSVVLPDVPQYMHRFLPLVTGLAVAHTLMRPWSPMAWLPGPPQSESPLHHIRLRWPNDVLVNGRKIAGVLSESIIMGQRAVAVVGVGMNVNADPAAGHPELADTATSLLRELGASVDLMQTRHALILSLNESFADLTAGHWARQHQEIRVLDFLQNRAVELSLDQRIVRGTGAGIAEDGALLLMTQSGLRSIYQGTILSVDQQVVRSLN